LLIILIYCTCSLIPVNLNFLDKPLITLGYLGLSIICTVFSLAVGLSYVFTTFPQFIKLVVIMAFMPFVSASPMTQPFPDISFKAFSGFVEQTFGSKISLATVLLLLFTMTENPELLNLHARQQHPIEGENKTMASGWIRALSHALMHRLKGDIKTVFRRGEYHSKQIHQVTKLLTKLDAFAKLLNLTPYDHRGKFKGGLQPVSYKKIQAIHTICPNSIICVDQ
jgi:hypothetical protein